MLLRVLVVKGDPKDVFLINSIVTYIGMPVILDLNLSRVRGFEDLARIRSSDAVRSLSVVLTGSLNRQDEIKAR